MDNPNTTDNDTSNLDNLDILSIEQLETQLIECRRALLLIQKIGKRYSGFGASCSVIASNALTGEPLTEQAKKTIQLVEGK